LASKGLGWAGGSHFELDVSSSFPLEPLKKNKLAWTASYTGGKQTCDLYLAPCGWRCPRRRLITLMRPFGNLVIELLPTH
jgi:hypothetical protein